MLPLLQLNLSTLSQSALDFSRLDGFESRALSDAEIERACRTYTGQSFAFRDEELKEVADQTKQNLDQLLSRHFACGFTSHPIKRQSLLWFGRRFDCVLITVSDSRGQLDPQWMRAVPGFFESGSDYVGRTDRPYGYWDGHNFHRIYPDVKISSSDRVLVSDFGNGFGWSVGESDANDIEAVSQLLSANPDSWEYSIVPKVHEEIVSINNSRCILLHSRYREVLL